MYVKKILIVGPSWVGDMMMAQVLFQLLHQQNPACELHVLAPAWSQALLSRMPEVQKSIVLPFGHGQLKLRARYQFAKQLKSENYDQAIVMPNSLKSALIPYWANIPKRTGWLGEYRFGLLNDIRYLNKKQLPKMVQRFAALAFSRETILPANLPIPQFSIRPADVDFALQKQGLMRTSQPIIALCPGAEFGSSKCWPPSHFAAIANQKLNEGWVVWIFGSANDRVIAETIQTQTEQRCVNLAGKTALSEAVDLLSLANCVVTNDSGLMHIAAALDRSVVALYGSTSPDYTPPLSHHAKIIKKNLSCQPCFKRECLLKHHDCMKLLLPGEVLKVMEGFHQYKPTSKT
ncbi:MAG: lipopolysaccharide heptosyltransferase II [Gammaproteobacteria bacterium RIFCSPHIGHO2_12_FULL_40_19]|nr:MAG: lipopolysaccharide heptosyltransferase II [Gammaproteobacteria bacterium RIFCSPHIGHO2_12_FULL_40_19]